MVEKHLLFVGGGTAGHMQPLLSIIKSFAENASDYDVTLRGSYVGTYQDISSLMLQEQLPDWCKTYSIPAGKLHRHLTFDQFRQIARLGGGIIAADRLMRHLKPDAIIAKGGYVSVPLIWAAKRRHIPIFCHETDVVPGLANRWVSRYADIVFTAFPTDAYHQIAKQKLQYVGQPVREEFFGPVEPCILEGVQLEEPLITVIGGSQGARRINSLVCEVWEDLCKDARLVHICGEKDLEKMREMWGKLPAEAQSKILLTPFVGSELPCLFKHSTVIISRAGGTIAELAAAGKPAILIPLSTAAQDHQQANAEVLREAGAAIVVDEKKTTSADLRDLVFSLLHDEEKRRELSLAIREFARPQAAEEIANTILKRITE